LPSTELPGPETSPPELLANWNIFPVELKIIM